MTDRKRHRQRDARIATVWICIPVDAETLPSVDAAIDGLAAHLPAGSEFKLLSKRFGRMAVAGQASNSGADVDGKRGATSSSEKAPESDNAAPQSGEGTVATSDTPAITSGYEWTETAPGIYSRPLTPEEQNAAPDDRIGMAANLDLPAAFDRRVPRVVADV